MSEMKRKICLGCMREIEPDVTKCPHCGFDPNTYQVNPRCLRLGTKLAEKYIIGKVIGEGGFGITYIGWDETLELPIAIKEFFPPKIASRDTTMGSNTIYMFEGTDQKCFENGMRRCVKEAKSMSKLESYEGIVTIRDFFRQNMTAYIIMEYVDGETLKEYMEKNGKMPAKDVLKVMKPIMKALDQMHQIGIIHRDISPDNIMIRQDGQVKLIDFGAARGVIPEEDEKSLTVMLKRGFSPEEQYRSKGHQGAWTDIYALCATLYYMLTGMRPPESIDRLLEDEYKSLISFDNIKLDEKIAKAIDKGLCVLAKDRYQSMGELIHDIYGEEEKRVIPGKERTDVEKVSAIEETVLDENNTVLIDDEMEVQAKANNRVITFTSRKKIMVVIAAVCIVVLGCVGLFAVKFAAGQREKISVTSKENVVKTMASSPSPTAVITMTPEIKQVQMPNCVNQKLEAATEQVMSIQQHVTIRTSEVYNDDVPVGNVVSQVPAAGALLNQGESLVITFVVSKGEERLIVPNVIGKSLSAAKKRLTKSRLKYQVKERYSGSYSHGKVISQSKRASTKVKRNTTIYLVVSKGPKPTPKPTPTHKPQATSRPAVRTQRPAASSNKSSKSKKKSEFQVIGSDDYVVLH